jgi:hypothetical protein
MKKYKCKEYSGKPAYAGNIRDSPLLGYLQTSIAQIKDHRKLSPNKTYTIGDAVLTLGSESTINSVSTLTKSTHSGIS